MILTCSKCYKKLNVTDDMSGKSGKCPACGQILFVPHMASSPPRSAAVSTKAITPPLPDSPSGLPQMALTLLRDPKEGTAYCWLIFFSLIVWLVLLLWIVFSLGGALLFIGLGALIRRMTQLFAAAYIKTNAVEVSDRQFPEIHSIVVDFSRKLGKTPPAVYVMQQNAWNSLAMILAGKRLVVLLSGAVDSLLLKGSMSQLAWLVGHELGHHYSGQLNFWRRTIASMGSWFVWVGLWYRRRCELTCDRYGLACANSLDESLRAVCNMSVGAQLAPVMDVEQAIAQWNRHRSEFFVKYRTIYSTHPHTLWRLDEMTKAAREMGIPH